MTQREMLDMMCAPTAIDEPEEDDFVPADSVDEKSEEMFVKSWLTKGA